MIDAVGQAMDDAGARSLLKSVGSVRAIFGMWPYQNPAAVVAERLGMTNVETTYTPLGGNMVQTVVNKTALEIQRGVHEAVVVTGAECGRSWAKARQAGIDLSWSPAPGTPDRVLGDPTPYVHETERALGIDRALLFYPVFENAIRHHRGEAIPTHLTRISELWARFSEVAVGNPHAWLRTPFTAEQIRTVSPQNRAVTFPYPKLMNSNNSVDQGAALILCSQAAARRHGISPERFVYPHVGTDAHDHLCVVHRDNLHSSPAIRIAGQRALELAGLDAVDVDLVDVYSCFPSAVQVAAAELGLSQNRDLTVTGGLTFAGGPHNNYVTHSIATMVERLREQPGALGLITANGGYLAKHAFGIYSTRPPARPFLYDSPQQRVDATPRRQAAVAYQGSVVAESYTAIYGEDGPTLGHVACLTPDGSRTWANVVDRDVLADMTQTEFCGKQGQVGSTGQITFD